MAGHSPHKHHSWHSTGEDSTSRDPKRHIESVTWRTNLKCKLTWISGQLIKQGLVPITDSRALPHALLRRWNFSCVSLSAGKFKQFGLHVRCHFFVFYKFKLTKYKQTQTGMKTKRRAKEKENHLWSASLWFVWSYQTAGSANYAHAHRVWQAL